MTRALALRCLVVVAGLLVLGGCQTAGPKFQPQAQASDSTLVYVYRKSGLVGSGNLFTIIANSKPIAELSTGSYAVFTTRDASIKFRVLKSVGLPLLTSTIDRELLKQKVLLTVSLAPGTTRYIEFSHGLGFATMEEVDEATGLSDMEDLGLAQSAAGE